MLRHISDLIPASLLALVLLTVPAGAETPSATALMAALSAEDAALAAGYTLTIELQVPAHPFDPVQGTEVRSCILTHDGEATALKTASTYDRDPVYRQLGEANYEQADFDRASNLILWRNRSKIGLSDAGVNASRAEVTMLRVGPGGEILERAPHTQLYHYLPGSEDNMPEVVQILMALGRGFSPYLESISDVQATASGVLEVRALGNFGPALWGQWQLTVDPETNLVRSATFTTDSGGIQPLLEVRTEGSLAARGLALAGRGSVRHLLRSPDAFYEVSVTASKLRPKADNGLLTQVRERVTAELPAGGEIVDFTTTPPTRITVSD